MDDWKEILPYIFAIAGGAITAYVTVKVTIAEVKKDIGHLRDKLETEITNQKENKDTNNENMKEVRGDVKAILSSLTKIQIDMAREKGRSDALEKIEQAVSIIADAKKGK